MNWKFLRIMSLFLTMVTVFYVLPPVVLAEGDTGGEEFGILEENTEYEDDVLDSEIELYDEDAAKEITAADLVGEVEELREEDTKHFRLQDGTYIAVQYDTAVHYLDEDGEWVDINNNLVPDEDIRFEIEPDNSGEAGISEFDTGTEVGEESSLESIVTAITGSRYAARIPLKEENAQIQEYKLEDAEGDIHEESAVDLLVRLEGFLQHTEPVLLRERL